MKFLRSLLLGLSLSISVAHAQVVTLPIPGSPLSLNVMANPQPLQNINNNPAATPYQLWDDGWANVPLEFTFPFFDKNFTNSTMYSNGTVQFGPPVNGFPANNTFCCNGISIDRNTPSAYNYSILMMQTDMYGSTGNNHYSLGNSTSMTYGWYNVERLGVPQNKTSFELKIDNTGNIDMRWSGALITMNTPAIGVIGDASKGEYAVIQQGSLNQNFTIPGLTQVTTGQTPDFVADPCATNPLHAPTCSGYQAAYTQQQCSIDPLYSTTCSGYQTAYTNQQCNINPLYSTTCSGYAQAYFNQQCGINPLYSTNCPGYAAAYLDQQCGINPLYSTTCSGYQQAYHNQQCGINALYSTTCSGYAAAYLAQQCSLDGLYDRTCPNYSTAYATKMVLEQQGTASIVATAGTVARNDPTNAPVSTTAVSTTVGSDGAVSVGVSRTGDSNVDKAIAPPPPSANAAASPSAPVQLVQAPPPPAAPPPAERKPEGGGEKQGGGEKPSGGTQVAQNDRGGDSKPAAPTARQELQARREAAAKAAAVESGKNLANEMGKAADMEAQKAVQNVVIQAMGFTPGFDAYGKSTIPDVVGYRPFTVYNNQRNIDNRNTARMFSGTDRVHNDIVESQYNLGTFGK
jgi:hypothetical protein